MVSGTRVFSIARADSDAAGAGNTWSYQSQSGETVRRSEGLAVASLEMFLGGLFSSDPKSPHQVTGTSCRSYVNDSRLLLNGAAAGLQALDVARLSDAFQVTGQNTMSGLEGRCNLLLRLGTALDSSPAFSQGQTKRPGHMLGRLHPSFDAPSLSSAVDHLQPSSGTEVRLDDVWTIVMEGFGPVWPASRTQLDGVSLGDAWPCPSLARANGSSLGTEASM